MCVIAVVLAVCAVRLRECVCMASAWLSWLVQKSPDDLIGLWSMYAVSVVWRCS